MKTTAIIGAILGLTSVMMGAAGDHLFSAAMTAESAERLDVALRYHQLYAILIFCLGLYGTLAPTQRALKWAGYLFCAGTVVFCGSLYASFLPGFDRATYLTPIGGTTLMLGWLFCLAGMWRLVRA